ncbi:unnamed protein product, partial [Sphagnum balticum]
MPGTSLGAVVPGAVPKQVYYLGGSNGPLNLDTDLSRGFLQLTSAQILALNSTPITIVPAPGAGYIIDVISAAAMLTFNTTAYTGTNALQIQYTNGSGAVTASFPSSFIDSAVTTYFTTVKLAASAAANAPLVVSVPTANPAAGDGTINIEV